MLASSCFPTPGPSLRGLLCLTTSPPGPNPGASVAVLLVVVPPACVVSEGHLCPCWPLPALRGP